MITPGLGGGLYIGAVAGVHPLVAMKSQVVAGALPDVATGNLLAWWRQNEGTGTIIADSHGSFDGVARGSGFWTENSPDGNPVGNYSGANDVNEIGTGLDFSGGDSITIQAFFWSSLLPAGAEIQSICTKVGAGGNGNFYIQLFYSEGNRARFAFYGGAAVWPTCQSWTAYLTPAVSTWYMLTMKHTYGDGSQVEILWNDNIVGVDKGVWLTGTGSEAASGQGTYVHIGSQDSTSGDDSDMVNPFKGRLGDVLIYDTLLSSANVTKNWDALKGRYNL